MGEGARPIPYRVELTAARIDALMAVTLPWAKGAHPEKYAATLKVSGLPTTFVAYMVRLLEIRWAEDGAIDAPWKLDVPLWALELTKLSVTVKWGDETIVVSGEQVTPRVWSFYELDLLQEQPELFGRLHELKRSLDLELVGVERE